MNKSVVSFCRNLPKFIFTKHASERLAERYIPEKFAQLCAMHGVIYPAKYGRIKIVLTPEIWNRLRLEGEVLPGRFIGLTVILDPNEFVIHTSYLRKPERDLVVDFVSYMLGWELSVC